VLLFGGEVLEERTFAGFTIPSQINVGWWFVQKITIIFSVQILNKLNFTKPINQHLPHKFLIILS
jgi:hypothetical protein